jgi:hypothetical protein
MLNGMARTISLALVGCRNISRNILHRVLQRHEILDRSAGATEKAAGEMEGGGRRFESVRGASDDSLLKA